MFGVNAFPFLPLRKGNRIFIVDENGSDGDGVVKGIAFWDAEDVAKILR
jgi:hypothetical protein